MGVLGTRSITMLFLPAWIVRVYVCIYIWSFHLLALIIYIYILFLTYYIIYEHIEKLKDTQIMQILSMYTIILNSVMSFCTCNCRWVGEYIFICCIAYFTSRWKLRNNTMCDVYICMP